MQGEFSGGIDAEIGIDVVGAIDPRDCADLAIGALRRYGVVKLQGVLDAVALTDVVAQGMQFASDMDDFRTGASTADSITEKYKNWNSNALAVNSLFTILQSQNCRSRQSSRQSKTLCSSAYFRK